MATTTIQEMVEGEQLLAVPPAFICPLHERPVTSHLDAQPPIIDVSGLLSPLTRPQLLKEISLACTHWGFFQAINHGVSDEVVAGMRAACWRFFNQPAEERNKFRCQRLDAAVSYSTSFNPSMEVTPNWKDGLVVRDIPGVCVNGFDIAPEICRKEFQEYRRSVDKLANMLYEAIIESLGLSLAEVKEAIPPLARLAMPVNFYPPCPDPTLTYGLRPHTDIGTISILLQDEVPGLQVKKGDDWILVKPLPNAFVINVSDQIEILSNGIYKSIEHRALTNSEKTRMSIPCLYGPDITAAIGPLPQLVSEGRPALYKQVKFEDYVENFVNAALMADRGYLNLAKIH